MKFTNEQFSEWVKNSIPGVEVELKPFKFTNHGLGPVMFKDVIIIHHSNPWDVFAMVKRVKEVRATVIGDGNWLGQCVMVEV